MRAASLIVGYVGIISHGGPTPGSDGHLVCAGPSPVGMTSFPELLSSEGSAHPPLIAWGGAAWVRLRFTQKEARIQWVSLVGSQSQAAGLYTLVAGSLPTDCVSR